MIFLPSIVTSTSAQARGVEAKDLRAGQLVRSRPAVGFTLRSNLCRIIVNKVAIRQEKRVRGEGKRETKGGGRIDKESRKMEGANDDGTRKPALRVWRSRLANHNAAIQIRCITKHRRFTDHHSSRDGPVENL